MTHSFRIWDATSAFENSHLLPGFSMFEVCSYCLHFFFFNFWGRRFLISINPGELAL